MSSSQHTPGEWKTGKQTSQYVEIVTKDLIKHEGFDAMAGNPIVDEEHDLIARVVGQKKEDHAAFIVRACNSHEDLLEACKRTLLFNRVGDDTLKMLTAAIAKATPPTA